MAGIKPNNPVAINATEAGSGAAVSWAAAYIPMSVNREHL